MFILSDEWPEMDMGELDRRAAAMMGGDEQ